MSNTIERGLFGARHGTSLLGLTAAALLGAACSDKETVSGPTGRLAIQTSALTLPGIVDADYGLAVYNSLGALVWEKSHLTSVRYGDGAGALSYVGPCDASASPNRVELTLHSISDAGGPLAPDAWQNPTANGPVAQTVPCIENTDSSVVFDLTIMRKALQGFFDIAVEFEDVFCSAKVDCKDELLHLPGSSARGPTVVVAFACTSGEGQPTWLHMSDVAVVCGDTYTWLDPHAGPGQVGAQSDAVWQLATYRGQEALADLDKCYWNLAVGLDVGLEGEARDCRLVGYATASHASFGEARQSPEGAVYPYVAFEVPLTDANASFVCGEHPLNEPGSGVATGYTPQVGKDFPWEWECSDTSAITESRQLCAAQVGAEPGAFVETPGGVVFSLGDRKSPLYALPDGQRLADCCANPCPGCQ